MTDVIAPSNLSEADIHQMLEQGRQRARVASVRAQVFEALQRHFTVEAETPDAEFDRAVVIRVRDGGDAWLISISLAADYAYVLREDTSQMELICAGSEGLESTEQTIMSILADHALSVLTLAELQHAVDSGDDGVSCVYELCFQEGGEAFWKFNWFAGEA